MLKTHKIIIIFLIQVIVMTVSASASTRGWQKQNAGKIWNNESPVIVRNGILYIFKQGGYLKAVLNQDGSMEPAQLVINGLTSGYAGGSVATTENLVITTGGYGINIERPFQQEVRTVTFKSDGSIDTVRISDYSVNVARVQHGSIVINQRLYLLGGISKDTSNDEYPVSSVEFAAINSDSSIGPFRNTAPFTNIKGQVYLAWNSGDTIYCYGTNPRGGCIESAVIESDGSIKQWSTEQDAIPFHGPSVLTNQKTLFTVQPHREGEFNNCFKTQVDGKMRSMKWVMPQHTLKPRAHASLVSWGRYVYLIGGWNPVSKTVEKSVEMLDPNAAETELFDDAEVILSINQPISLNEW